MKLMLTTQYRENYGAWDWDGKGACPQYWKNKGGVDYFYTLPDTFNSVEALKTLVDTLALKVEKRNDYVEEYLVDWSVERDDYLTPFEQDQLEYDGVIKYPARDITLE